MERRSVAAVAHHSGRRYPTRPDQPPGFVEPDAAQRRVSFFESWEQVDMLEADPGDWGPLAILAVGTGMVQQEWTALERRDIDLRDRVVTVRRFVVNGMEEARPRGCPLSWRRRGPMATTRSFGGVSARISAVVPVNAIVDVATTTLQTPVGRSSTRSCIPCGIEPPLSRIRFIFVVELPNCERLRQPYRRSPRPPYTAPPSNGGLDASICNPLSCTRIDDFLAPT